MTKTMTNKIQHDLGETLSRLNSLFVRLRTMRGFRPSGRASPLITSRPCVYVSQTNSQQIVVDPAEDALQPGGAEDGPECRVCRRYLPGLLQALTPVAASFRSCPRQR